MTPVEFCEEHCGQLTLDQRCMVEHASSEDRFLGVGRSVGGHGPHPLVLIGDKRVQVIDGAGHYQFASLDDRIGYRQKKGQ